MFMILFLSYLSGQLDRTWINSNARLNYLICDCPDILIISSKLESLIAIREHNLG